MKLIITFLRFYWLGNIVQNWIKEYFKSDLKKDTLLLHQFFYRYIGIDMQERR